MLTGSAGATAALSLAALPQEANSAPPKAKKEGPLPFKISLAQWSLHREFKSGQLDTLDFAKTANAYGIDGIEYVNQLFSEKAKDKKYIAELKTRAAGEGVWSVLIMIDREGALGDADKAKRTLAVDNHKKWVEIAAYLGCHSIRVNAHSGGSYEEQIKLAADGLRRLSEFADPFGINIIVENHGGLSSNGAWLAEVIKTSGHPRTGTLPDFGNFKISDTESYDRYKGVEELMPFARGVSAKTHDFDAKGNEIHTDYARMMKIVAAAGYHGYVGIEYEGEKLPEREGILKTKKLLEKVRSKMG